MANLILRPDNDGIYGAWTGDPSVDLWTNINDKDPDGDTSYVYTLDEGAAFTCVLSNTVSGNFPRPMRIKGITVIATVRAVLNTALTRFRFRLRYLGVDYDSKELYTTDVLAYREFYQAFIQVPTNGDAFSNNGLNTMEVGLVYVDGPDALRCTKLEVQVHHEPFPNVYVGPTSNGSDQAWNLEPSTTQAYMCVDGPFDGDLSYLYSNVPGDRSVFGQAPLPGLTPPNIEKVRFQALVKNYGLGAAGGHVVVKSGGSPYLGATSTLPQALPDDDLWHIWAQEYLNDPNVGWPSGDPSATPWTPAEVNAVEIGPQVDTGGVRCTSLQTEVWLKYTPLTVIDLYPDGDGALTDLPALVPGAGEDPWEDIDETPPDDAGSYIGGDADTFQAFMKGTFTVPAAGAIPAGERVNNVELRYRLRLGTATTSTVVAALVRDPATLDTYISEPQLIEGTGTTWFDVVWNLGTNPFGGVPWASSTEVSDLEHGFVILSGDCWLSRLRVQIQTTLDIRQASDPLDLKLTDAAVALMTRSLTDGTIYAVTEFAVGTGGFNPVLPAQVVAVNTADTALTAEVYRAPLTSIRYNLKDLSGHVTIVAGTPGVTGVGTAFTSELVALDYVNIAGEVHQVQLIVDDVTLTLTANHVAGATDVSYRQSPMEVDYFCRVPKEEAVDSLGEIGLWAEIFWSPFPAEIGTKFMFAKEHTPAQCLHDNMVVLYRVRVNYP